MINRKKFNFQCKEWCIIPMYLFPLLCFLFIDCLKPRYSKSETGQVNQWRGKAFIMCTLLVMNWTRFVMKLISETILTFIKRGNRSWKVVDLLHHSCVGHWRLSEVLTFFELTAYPLSCHCHCDNRYNLWVSWQSIIWRLCRFSFQNVVYVKYTSGN